MNQEEASLEEKLILAEAFKSKYERELFSIWNIVDKMNLREEFEKQLEENSTEEDVTLLVKYIGSERYVREENSYEEGDCIIQGLNKLREA